MTTGQVAELRKWHKQGSFVTGLCYNDPHDFYDDGDDAYIGPITQWEECSTFFLAHCNNLVFKCPKDEEQKE